MAWNLEDGRPIYAQLVERLQVRIVSGRYGPGKRLPSVRELAAEASVNPNTMQKAFAELEKSGLILTQRTNGRTVTEDEALIQRSRQRLAEGYRKDYFAGMKELGYSEDEAAALLYNRRGGMENERTD